MKLKERRIAGASLFVALAVAALVIAGTRVRKSEARAPGATVAAVQPASGPAESAFRATVAAVQPAPGPAVSAPRAAPDDGTEIIGEAEPLLVRSPSPHRDHPGRSARRIRLGGTKTSPFFRRILRVSPGGKRQAKC